MLKFGNNSVAWGSIAHFSIEDDSYEVSLTTTDSVVLVVKNCDSAEQAAKLEAALEASKVAADGGVTIVIIIDDL